MNCDWKLKNGIEIEASEGRGPKRRILVHHRQHTFYFPGPISARRIKVAAASEAENQSFSRMAE